MPKGSCDLSEGWMGHYKSSIDVAMMPAKSTSLEKVSTKGGSSFLQQASRDFDSIGNFLVPSEGVLEK